MLDDDRRSVNAAVEGQAGKDGFPKGRHINAATSAGVVTLTGKVKTGRPEGRCLRNNEARLLCERSTKLETRAMAAPTAKNKNAKQLKAFRDASTRLISAAGKRLVFPAGFKSFVRCNLAGPTRFPGSKRADMLTPRHAIRPTVVREHPTDTPNRTSARLAGYGRQALGQGISKTYCALAAAVGDGRQPSELSVMPPPHRDGATDQRRTRSTALVVV